MNNFRAILTASVVAFGLIAVTACSKKAGEGKHDHAHHHHHTAPHGGALVEVGEHQFNLEFVRDETTGTLTAYLLDAHAEGFIRSPLPAIAIVATVNGAPRPLSLAATGSTATGETVGDTSAFAVQADWLKTTPTFDVVIPTLEIRGATFTNVKFNFPKGSQEDDDHGH